jgi:tRNA-Thr(GGU) m(6)t(6)A37 methyltransferase TsaA
MSLRLQAIATLRTPFRDRAGMPIQPSGAAGIRGTVEVLPEFAPGLQDIEGFSHIILIYYLHRQQKSQLSVVPFLDTQPRGIFATRSPARPNPIGLSVVRLLGREDRLLHVENVDMLDETPVLDIKPYVPEFDVHPGERIGWIAAARGESRSRRSDNRFE